MKENILKNKWNLIQIQIFLILVIAIADKTSCSRKLFFISSAVSVLSLNQIYLKDKILKAYSQNIKFV